MTALLEVDELHVRYGSVTALRGIDLRVEQGEVVGVVGPNGAGKTSLLAAVAGIVKVADGSIRFDGGDLRNAQPQQIVRRGLALVPEGRRIFGTLTVQDNLLLGATIRRDRHEVLREIDELYGRFEALGRYRHSSAALLSGGEQQMLAIGRALLSRPRLLLLDEPSLGLAPLVVQQVFDTVCDLRERGVTVLLVEQNALKTIDVSDRTYVLRTGTVALSGTRDELHGRSDIVDAYLGLGLG